ncbi:Short chain dehydrogenase [Minicystis rosea]|nr:Short chain dehydrogenase [Minicystis rosea]
MDLDQRTIIVVGGSSGIGLGVARAARARGAEVVLAARDEKKLEAAAREIGGARTVAIDMAREEDVERLFASEPHVDHVVVTAADLRYQPVASFDLAAARRVVETKILGPLLIAKHAAPRMREGGSITLTAGVAADRPTRNGAMVATVNAGLAGLCRALAIELAPIRVNVISPGWVDTPFWDAFAGPDKDARLNAAAARLLVGRVGRPEDIAHAVMFLIENGFTTGEVLHVDGGHRIV